MIYNPLGKSGVNVSALSLGTMRWDSEEECFQTVNKALDLGVNYLDTSTGYCGGESYKWSAAAVKARRSEMYFSCKSNWSAAPKADEVRRVIETTLDNCGLDYFDFYQIWGLQTMEVLDQALAKGGMIEGIRKAQDDGLIKIGLGFTYHGIAEQFKAAVDCGEFLCATISYSLANLRHEEQVRYATQKGVGVIAMNPLGGGGLADKTQEDIQFLAEGGDGPAYGALRFVLANKNVATSLIGFQNSDEFEPDFAALEGADKLDENYRTSLITKMAESRFPEGHFCTGCGYCKACPRNVDPPKLMMALRDFDRTEADPETLGAWLQSRYIGTSPQEILAQCTECGECEEKCTQHLKIISQIQRASAALQAVT
jgi:predicted aldo/keto reductase-like oxidoreductase